jgi:hypothetical protein
MNTQSYLAILQCYDRFLKLLELAQIKVTVTPTSLAGQVERPQIRWLVGNGNQLLETGSGSTDSHGYSALDGQDTGVRDFFFVEANLELLPQSSLVRRARMRRNRGLSWDSVRFTEVGQTTRLVLSFHLVL